MNTLQRFSAVLLLLGAGLVDSTRADEVQFNRDIRPILSDKCFTCHGPDEKARKADLRLDTYEGAVDGGAIVPGKSAASTLVRRILETRPNRQMPPPASGKSLKPEQIALLKRWIDQGAKYQGHWAFLPPQKSPVPAVQAAGFVVRNPIDAFVLARLQKEGLKPSPEADRRTLIRRVTLDLTGLPPTPAEVQAFVNDQAPNAYERLVQRLLKSPHYGEHMARYWLDAVRYGDTHGLHLDNYREMWPYRDWVIRAFQSNMPFNQFTTEQLAGDLLPNATLSQKVASGYNRAHVSTSEGGSIEEEVYVRNVVDRVETTGSVFLGMTIGCAVCHDHKYDPVSQKDFYSLFAFFNNVDGSDLDGNRRDPPPTIRVPTVEQEIKLKALEARRVDLRKRMAEAVAKMPYDAAGDARESEEQPRTDFVWIDDTAPGGSKPVGGHNVEWNFVPSPDHPVHSGKSSLRLSAQGLQQLVLEGATSPLRIGQDDVLFAHVYLDPKKPPRQIMLQWHSSGWSHRAYWGENLIPWGDDNSPQRRRIGDLPKAGGWVRLEVPAALVGLTPGTQVTGWAFTQHDGTGYWDRAGLVTKTPQQNQAFTTLSAWVRAQRGLGGAGLPGPIAELIKLDRAKRTPAQQKQLLTYFLENAYAKTREVLAMLQAELAAIDREQGTLETTMPTTLVMRERPTPRDAFVLIRGQYDQRGPKVDRATPGFLPPLPKEATRDRLGLARWLTDAKHPLTARVAVNRFWQQLYGIGIVRTAEDFGVQGEWPSHPELLDWLAVQFIEDGWDVKRFMEQLVLSSTYRQSSRVTPELRTRDPENRLLARGPRFRLDAEMLRDQAFFVSGLLVDKLGGPSVKPPQPSGLWEGVGYTTSDTARFEQDSGDKIYRRSLYTFWKRTSPPPQMTVFDAPSREACTVRRERTNTPLQALTLMNERQFVEAARFLAGRMIKEGGTTPESRVAFGFAQVTGRSPNQADAADLLSAYQLFAARFRSNPEAAAKLIRVGDTPPDAKLNPQELATWTLVANLLLNLDEVLCKE